jgi:hypothetical protein
LTTVADHGLLQHVAAAIVLTTCTLKSALVLLMLNAHVRI